MKSIIEELGIDITLPSIVATFGNAADGKSSFMACIIKELHDAGKNVSIISDDSDALWMRRLKNVGCTSNGAKIIYKHLPICGVLDVLTFIKKQKDAFPFIDCVVIDMSMSNNNGGMSELVSFIRNNNMILFTTQHQRGLNGTNPYDAVTNVKSGIEKMLVSDVAISIQRKREPKLSLWKRFLNLFRPIFGLEKYVAPNIKLTVLKNRRGPNGYHVDYNLDFSKINTK